MIATQIADAVISEMGNLQNLADGGNFTDAELCRLVRKTLNKASKGVTGEIKYLESSSYKRANTLRN